MSKFEITQSMLNLFEKCGKAFEFRYLQDIKVAPLVALTIGRSVDEGIGYNLTQKIQSEIDLPLGDVVDATVTAFNREAPETNFLGEPKGLHKDVAVALVKAHHEELAETIKPLEVQKKLIVELEHYNIGGTLDLIEKDKTIGDHKTAKNLYDVNAVSQTIQPAMYSLLFEKTYHEKPKAFRYDVLVKPTSRQGVRTQRVTGQVSEQQKVVLLKRTDTLYQAIHTGTFHYAPDSAWWCSEKWCGFWNICDRGGKKK